MRAQKTEKVRREFGSLLGAAGKVANRFGAVDVLRVVNDVYTADATEADVTAAAKDLGLSGNAFAANTLASVTLTF